MTEEERKAIVEGGPVYLSNGLCAGFAGWKNPHYCGVHSAKHGFWACSWETARDVLGRVDRRFTSTDGIWCTGYGWLGFQAGPEEYQTTEDWERASR